MNVPFNDLYAQYLSLKPEIDDAIARTIQNSAFVRGPEVELFEENFAKLIGVDHCVSCANGTDALYIAMHALGVKQGDEVIVPAHSWISTSETVTQAGGKVVFCDTRDTDFTIDIHAIEATITDRTVGIIPVHLCGHPAQMGAVMRIAKNMISGSSRIVHRRIWRPTKGQKSDSSVMLLHFHSILVKISVPWGTLVPW